MVLSTQKTYLAKTNEVAQKYYLIDAQDQILGKVAAKAATYLRGKHKTTYTPHIDTGDFIVIINAEKVRVTGKKLTDKEYQRYSGYPSGQKRVPLGVMLKNRPTEVLKLAVNRMIPKGPLGNKIRTKLKVYAGDQHPHKAQKPEILKIA